MDGFEFQDFGPGAWLSDRSLLPQSGTTQYHPIPQLPCFSEVDASPYGSGCYYDGILTKDQTLNASCLDSFNLQTSTREFESVDVAVLNAVSPYAMGGINAIAHDASHTGSRLIGNGLRCLDSAGEPTSAVSTHFTSQQSLPRYTGQRCVISSCDFRYCQWRDYQTHLQAVHQDAFTCDECMYVGKSQYELGLHASNTGHASFICKHDGCEKKFARLDTYQRHQRTHREDAKRFPCKFCKKYRGKNGFKRKDHLTQHLRNYHHIGEGKQVGHMDDRKWCPKEGCTESKPATVSWWNEGPFTLSKEWRNHMRTVHDESEFTCPQPGCDRVNGKGYFRLADLRTHLRKVHGTDCSFYKSTRNDLTVRIPY